VESNCGNIHITHGDLEAERISGNMCRYKYKVALGFKISSVVYYFIDVYVTDSAHFVYICSISLLSRCIPDESYLSAQRSDILREFFGLSGGGNLLRKFLTDVYNVRHQVFAVCGIAVGEYMCSE